jgi:glycosyltransferase involved in cell wall biosynthesis
MAKVSVLLTCYNHFRYLPACVEGVRAQTFRDYEIVAIDDGSADGSREWLAEQPDIRCIFNETNLGTYATLNVGLRETERPVCRRAQRRRPLGADEAGASDGALRAAPEMGLVHTGGRFIDGEGNVTLGNPLGFEFPRTESGDVLLALVYANKIIASAALVRRRCFEELGGFNEAYFGSGDWEMWFRLAERFAIGFVDEPLTDYRVHGANASHKLERIWRDDQMLREWMAPRLKSYGERFEASSLRQAQAHNQAALGTVRTLNGDPSGGRSAYARSIGLHPGRLKSYLRYAATFLQGVCFGSFFSGTVFRCCRLTVLTGLGIP